MFESYEYYLVTFRNDDEEIVMASSPEDAKEEQEELYGKGAVRSVSTISREELISSDFDAEENHEKNIAALGGDVEESIEEKLQPSDPIDNYIRDFQQSDAPQFKGKSKEKRRQMAIAAKLNAEAKDEKAMEEGRTLKTMAARYITQRKKYNAANDEVKKTGKNVHDVARKHNVDTKELQSMSEGEKKGLWANIHAKRKRGEPPAKPGDKNYPKTLNIEETNPIMEGEDKLMYLARLGLMQKNEVLLLKRAMQQRNAGVPMSMKNRNLLLKLMDKLLRLIIDNPHMWNLARRKVVEDVLQEFDDSTITEQWNTFITNYDKSGEN